ncbi:MAG: hypothetical protein JWN53_620 [Gemmatimonadetes bacterium]|nr:hypothetical protein [Gemmatimonadota bacterium]
MHRLALLLLLPLASCANGAPPSTTPEPTSAAGAISAEALRRDLLAFADDSMRGRETGTMDADRAALFLADRARALGLEPAGDSLFYQHVPLVRETFTPASRVVVRANGTDRPLRLGADVAPLLTLADGLPPTRRHAAGEIVFVSYGLTTRTPRRDDFAGLDLEGKVVVVVNGAPAGADSATRDQLEAQGAISDRLGRILPQHPAAVVILLTGKGRDLYDQFAPQLMRSVTAGRGARDVPESERELPLILLGVAAAGSPLLPTGWPTDDRARWLEGRRLIADLQQERTAVMGYNVAAVVRGTDPQLGMTYVAFGAHYDHIGVVPPVHGDSIANGADDDGSGSVSLLAIARAMQAAPLKPKRSTLFVWHVGEEKGLLGSSWFVDHPTVPIDSIVAQINADMIGRNAPDLLYVVGPRSAPNAQSRRLGGIVDSVNAAQPRPFAIDRSFDAPTHPEHIYERSDHFNYARKGIPIVFFTTGLHEDYHRPSDEVSKIDFAKMARVDQLLLDVGLAVANGVKRPK